MQKLQKDLQLSHPEFKALHLIDLCRLLNNALEGGIRTNLFSIFYDFVVHFPPSVIEVTYYFLEHTLEQAKYCCGAAINVFGAKKNASLE